MTESSRATVAQLWRYPVKSMRGERVEETDVGEAGFLGDRAYAVVDVESGKVASAKHPRLWGALLQCDARYVEPPAASGPRPPVAITLPNHEETRSDDPRIDTLLSDVLGRAVRLATVAPEGNGYLAVWPEIDGVVPDDFRAAQAVDGDEADGTLTGLSLALASPPGTFFDVAALHLVTTATLAHLGDLAPTSRFAVERYRPNVVLEADVEPFAENAWTGAGLELGGVGASVLLPTMRCIMTTLAQHDLPRDAEVLRTVARHNRVELPGLGTWSCVGAYAAVTADGRVGIGDEVTLPTG